MNLGILTVLGIVILAEYGKDPSRFLLAVLLGVIIALLFYIWYGPKRRRKKNADKIGAAGGEYRLLVTESGIQFGEEKKKLIWEEGKMIFYTSDHMYTLKAGREVFAIPRRILGKEQQESLMQLMRQHGAQIINVRIEKE